MIKLELTMLGVILKFLIPVIIFYFIQKFARQAINDLKGANLSNQKNDRDQIIDICPECGKVRNDHHQC